MCLTRPSCRSCFPLPRPTCASCARLRPQNRAIGPSRLSVPSAPHSLSSLPLQTGRPSWSLRKNKVRLFKTYYQSGGYSPVLTDRHTLGCVGSTAPPPPARTYPGGADASDSAAAAPAAAPQMIDGFEIPPDIDIPPNAAAGGGDAAVGAGAGDGGGDAQSGAGGGGGDKICPTCTFANPPDAGPDCEMCGLPLSG